MISSVGELRERNQLLIDQSFSFSLHGMTVSNRNEKRVGAVTDRPVIGSGEAAGPRPDALREALVAPDAAAVQPQTTCH